MTQRVERLGSLAHDLINLFVHQNQDVLGDRRGCCLAIWDLNGPDIEVFRLGSIPFEKIPEKERFAREKVRRLESHPSHLTSFESAIPEKEQYGGGVRVSDTLLMAASAFSPAYLDQEFCVLLGLVSHQMSLSRAQKIYKRTLHHYPTTFRQYFHRK